ncbi:MAG TPA: peptidoglycan DD-metalloendopeptidase family protein [Thermoleophilaceae bacterium]|nr:peptidoglycan DD-metalloendopeptidase family protein [Thermoleophilaceae bacterium]
MLAPVAGAQAPGPGGGGGLYVAVPKITKVSCVRRCASRSRAQGGSTIKLTGSGLSTAAKVIFGGSYGSADDLATKVRSRSDTTLSVRVPIGAITGPITVVTAEKAKSKPTRPVAILPPPPPEPNAVLSAVPGLLAGVKVETGTSRTRAYVGARRAVTFSYRITGALADAPTVELVRASDGTAVKTWTPDAVPSGELNSISWDGRLGSRSAKPGRYSFRLSADTSAGAEVRTAQADDSDRDAFDLYDNMFPVRGRHNYGDAGARFGARRSGHRHQGQDVMARCGTPLVAARGGKVKFKQYHAAAGNYVVIDAAGTDVDYVYMHLAEPTPFRPGDRVYTGQRIGSVGDTGDAQGCHLHIELWTGPGWYDGGKPFDPLSSLRAWDSWS